MRRSKSRSTLPTFALVIGLLLFSGTNANADEYIILDGLGGMGAHWMQGAVTRLECEGHQVTYRPWWRWRSAVRRTNQPVNIIGYSLGGSRAVWAAERLDVTSLELVDPVRMHGTIQIPPCVNTTIYSAGDPSVIQNRAEIIGSYNEIVLPARHIELWQYFGE